METLLDMDEATVGASPISEKVWASCLAGESVLSADRVSGMDYWVSYLALYFDINFPETWQIIRENHYIDRIAARVPYSREGYKRKGRSSGGSSASADERLGFFLCYP